MEQAIPAAGLVDIGANLTHDSFAADRNDVLERAKDAGVKSIIITGASEQGSGAAVKLAGSLPGLYATAGIHPHEAGHFSADSLNHLGKLAQTAEVVAMGECGLDFYRDFSPRPKQESCFEQQLELACEIKKPVFLHERDAHDRFVKILQPYLNELSAVVVHCFTGNQTQLETYLELDCHIGITGWICDERRGRHLKEIVGLIPGNRLMLETDAPYLLPRDLQPKPASRRNEPMHLPHIAMTVAEVTGKTFEQVAAETSQTAKNFFNI